MGRYGGARINSRSSFVSWHARFAKLGAVRGVTLTLPVLHSAVGLEGGVDMKRRGFIGAIAGAGAAMAAIPVSAQAFPSKPIRWIVPFAPGGNYDVTSRIVAEVMGRRLGQTVLVDNRPGAGGVVGLEATVTALADGYTVVMGIFSV